MITTRIGKLGLYFFLFKNAAFLPPRDRYVDVEEDEEDEEDEEYDDDDDNPNITGHDEKSGLACPFWSDDFDVLGLCSHIDVDHHNEVKAVICPVCAIKVETNMAVHLIIQHETILKILSKKKFCNGGSRPALPSLKKELRDEHLHSPPKGSSRVNSSPAVEPDSLLLPFFYNPQPSPKPDIVSPPIEATSLGSDSPYGNLERDVETPAALPDNGEEKAQRCEFLCGLFFSTIFRDKL